MHPFDWNGATNFLAGLGVFLPGLATLAMQLIKFRDDRRKRLIDERKERTLNAVANAVGVLPEEKQNGKPS